MLQKILKTLATQEFENLGGREIATHTKYKNCVLLQALET